MPRRRGACVGLSMRRTVVGKSKAAVAGLLVLLGILADDVAQQVLLIAAAVLATGEGVMAAAHTPARRE